MEREQRDKIRVAMNRPEVKAKIARKMVGNQFAKGYQWTEEQKQRLSKSLVKHHLRVKRALALLEVKETGRTSKK